MNGLRYHLEKFRLQLRRRNEIIGWNMTPAQAKAFFVGRKKTVVTLYGYSKNYQDPPALFVILRSIFSRYSPDNTLINIGGTSSGIGAAYPLAKSMGFTTTGITSTRGIIDSFKISDFVDYICFIKDDQWGGKMPNSNELSPTSQAMVICSDIMIGIGGGKISRDELLAGKGLGKPIEFFPAEIEHTSMLRDIQDRDVTKPNNFSGEAHEHFGHKRR